MDDQLSCLDVDTDGDQTIQSPESLAELCVEHFEETSHLAHLDLAISKFRKSLNNASNNAVKATHFQIIGEMYSARFPVSNDMSDSNKAIENQQAAVDHTPLQDPLRVDRQADLALSIYAQYLSSDDRNGLDRCIRLFEECLEQTDSEYLDPLYRHEFLANMYRARWLPWKETLEDLNRSIFVFEQLLKFPENDEISYLGTLVRLGELYLDRVKKTNNLVDLELSIKRSEEALEITRGDDFRSKERTEALECLGDSFEAKFQRLGGLGNLDSAIRRYEEAVNSIPEDSGPIYRFHLLLKLDASYGYRSANVMSISDIDISIRVLRDALNVIRDLPDRLSDCNIRLAGRYRQRFIQSQEKRDIDDSISLIRKSRDSLPRDDPMFIRCSQDLSTALKSRYERFGRAQDIDESIEELSKALSKFDEAGETPRSYFLRGLAESYLAKYDRVKRLDDLEKAIHYCERETNSFSTEDPNLPSRLIHLSSMIDRKHKKTKANEDFERNVKTIQRAIDLTPDDHPDRSYRLHVLGLTYKQRKETTKSESDTKIAIKLHEQAFRHPVAPVGTRLLAGSHILDLLIEVDRIPAAYQIATETLSLVSHLTPRSLEVSDKQLQVRKIQGLPSLVAALSLMAGEKPYKAVQHLELGRGIILGSLNDLRVDTVGLEASYPDIAAEFIQLRNQLDTNPGSITGVTNPRYDASRQLDSMIGRIRELPGFGDFLLPLSEAGLMSAAARGPVVVINVDFNRSDALVIQTDQITCVKLPELYLTEAEDHAEKPQIEEETLEWLWSVVAGPVLKHLGHLSQKPPTPLPRIFWVPTGPLAKLPIHAAGYIFPDRKITVMDCVISTYSSSVRALIQGRQNAKGALSRKRGKAILIGVKELKYARKEITELGKLCKKMNLETHRLRPSREKVLASLADCDIFHFAGHGKSDSINPSKSSLNMEDGLLTVQDLFNMRLHDRAPFLAYLSACSTGQIQDKDLMDEGMHLIGACQLAGFRNVVGTLRKVDDKFCVEVATLTYKWIRDHGLSDESVGDGLHHAIKYLRDQWLVENEGTEIMQRGLSDLTVTDTLNRDFVARQSRDIADYEPEPISWAPFVYFGI